MSQVCLPDGSRHYFRYEQVLAEAQTPTDASNRTATAKTVEILEVMAAAAVNKVHSDPKLAIADNKLASQKGAIFYLLNTDAHKVTLGAHNTNDAVKARARTYRVLTKYAFADSFVSEYACSSYLSAHARVIRSREIRTSTLRPTPISRRLHRVGVGRRAAAEDARFR
eukprot:2556549-Pleurochrysis_carterae.AAC.1